MSRARTEPGMIDRIAHRQMACMHNKCLFRLGKQERIFRTYVEIRDITNMLNIATTCCGGF